MRINALAKLVTGTGGAQLVLLLFSPVVARIYSPDSFGFYSSFLSVSLIVSILSTARYELAFALEDVPERKSQILNLCLVMNFLYTLVIFTVGVVLLELTNYRYFGDASSYLVLVLGSLVVFISGLERTFRSLVSSYRRFGVVAKNALLLVFLTIVMQVMLSPLGFLGLIWANIVALFVSSLVLLKALDDSVGRLDWDGLKSVAVRHSRFPKYTSLSALLNRTGKNVAPILLVASFGGAAVGLYAMAARVIVTPTRFIGRALTDLFYYDKGDGFSQKDVGRYLRVYVSLLFSVILFPAVVLLSYAPKLFGFVFGVEWMEAGQVVTGLVPLMVGAFVVGPVSRVVFFDSNNQRDFWFQITLSCLRIGALVTGCLLFDFRLTVSMYGMVSFIVYASYLYCLLHWYPVEKSTNFRGLWVRAMTPCVFIFFEQFSQVIWLSFALIACSACSYLYLVLFELKRFSTAKL